MEPGTTLEVLIRGIAAGAQIGLGLALARNAAGRAVSIATVLFFAANFGFLLNGAAAIRHAIGPLSEIIWLIQIGGAGFLWLFVVTLFEDREINLATLAPAAALTVLGVIARLLPAAAAPVLWTAHNLAGLLLAAHGVMLILRSGKEDLVEERRRLRVPVMTVIALYSILLSLAQIGQLMGYDAAWYRLADAVAQAALGLLGIAAFLTAREAIFGRVKASTRDGLSAPAGDPDELWAARLDAVMRERALWQKEGLTIAELAEAVGLPEHRLRRLINHTLGHRNFPSFINQHRINAAKTILADPASARRTVASIAFDLGFASLGPFNRAFRDATGASPTDYRRQALAQASPIPENSR
jgi:AraC-like DNA-binding protein